MAVTITPRILDSRDLWRAYPRIQKLWEDWIYLDVNEKFREAEAQALAQHALGTADVYVVIGRHESYVAHSSDAVSIARRLMEYEGKHDVDFCSLDFTRFLQFHHIGVARAGKQWSEGDVGYRS